MQTDNRQTILD